MSTREVRLQSDKPPEDREPAVRFGKITRAVVLLILAQGTSYGYDIRRQLEDFGYDRADTDPGALYRLLREMETEGFISSEWSTGGSGPQRRYYSPTASGRIQLQASARAMVQIKQRAERFLAVYDSLESAAHGGTEAELAGTVQ